jgi:nitrogen fixation protein FixH
MNTRASPATGAPRELTEWHVLGIVLVFFGTIIAVNVVMAFAAVGTFPGLVVENSYLASQHYDDLIDKARAQDAKGLKDALSAKAGVLTFRLADAAGAPVAGLEVAAHVGRPSTTREDRDLAFAPRSDGIYVAGDALPAGLWEVDLEARRGADLVFRRTQEVHVDPPEAVK